MAAKPTVADVSEERLPRHKLPPRDRTGRASLGPLQKKIGRYVHRGIPGGKGYHQSTGHLRNKPALFFFFGESLIVLSLSRL